MKRAQNLAREMPQEYEMVLDYLAEQHPRYLAELLKTDQLKQVAHDRTLALIKTLSKLQDNHPQEPYENLREIAQAEHFPASLDFEDQEPLTVAEERKFQTFKEKTLGY